MNILLHLVSHSNFVESQAHFPSTHNLKDTAQRIKSIWFTNSYHHLLKWTFVLPGLASPLHHQGSMALKWSFRLIEKVKTKICINRPDLTRERPRKTLFNVTSSIDQIVKSIIRMVLILYHQNQWRTSVGQTETKTKSLHDLLKMRPNLSFLVLLDVKIHQQMWVYHAVIRNLAKFGHVSTRNFFQKLWILQC